MHRRSPPMFYSRWRGVRSHRLLHEAHNTWWNAPWRDVAKDSFPEDFWAMFNQCTSPLTIGAFDV